MPDLEPVDTDDEGPPHEADVQAAADTRRRSKKARSGVTYYAWSRFPTKQETETGFYTEYLMEGDEVTAQKLGIDAEEFDRLVAIGSVREEKYPVSLNSPLSPTEHKKKLLSESATIEEE